MQELAHESLQIVGDELTVTLNDVRAALEQYVDGGGGPQTIDKCAGLLHAANGALRVAETYGASLLAEEMESTCRYLGKIRPDDARAEEALEALTRAAVQLPAYVDLIMNGGRDIPLVLLPLLNDLRAARGRPLLSESTLLLLNIGSPDPRKVQPESHGGSGENIDELCRKLRPIFQLALLGWIRGDQPQENLARIGQVAERLERAAGVPEAHQLWWVVGGVVEALIDGGLETSVSLKRLMGQADRELKRLPAIGEESYREKPPVELVNNLLYYIARSTSSGPRVGAIRAAFNLSDLVPGNDQVEQAREQLAAPSARLMTTVAQAIRDDLARVKDVFDIYVRTGMQHVEELAPQIELLKKIGDTLGVLGLGDLRETMKVKRDELQQIIDSGRPVEEAVLLDLASALLYVEDNLDERLFRLIRPADAADDGEQAETVDAEFTQVARAVMRECVVNLARVKDAVALVLERPNEAAVLDSVPVHLRGITAGLIILEKDNAVSVVEEIGEFIGELIEKGYEGVGREQLDLLADAVVSLEYYLETLKSGRREPVYMLENARECLRVLRASEPAPMPGIAPEEDVAGLATTLEIPKGEAGRPTEPTQVIPQMTIVAPDAGERIDPELIELFIEEAGEEIDSIRKAFPAWQEDEGQQELLLQIRRSFHTLKGSGRMVGAELIGQFSWCFEDLLNRLINGTLERNEAILECVRQATEALPELLEQLEVGAEPEADIAGLMRTAEKLATGTAQAAESDESLAETTVLGAEEPGAAAPIDAALMEILSSETGAHLQVIREFIEAAAQGFPPFEVSEELYRACHTLHGSATMAQATPVAAVSGPLNRMIRRAYDHRIPLDEHALGAVTDAAAAIADIVSALEQGNAALPDTEALQNRLREIDAQVDAAAERAEAEQEESIPPGILVKEFAAEEGSAATMPAGDDGSGEPSAAAAPKLDPEIAAIFAEEAAEILEAIDREMSQAAGGRLAVTALAELQRHLHTLKGGARLAGLMAMGNLSHDLETLLVRLSGGALEQTPARFGVMRSTVDELHRLRERVADGEFAMPSGASFERLAAALEEGAGPEPHVAEPTAAPRSGAEAWPAAGPSAEQPREEFPAQAPEQERAEEEPTSEEPALEEPTIEEPMLADAGSAAGVRVPSIPVSPQLGELARELDAPPVPQARDLAELVQASTTDAPQRTRELARVDAALLEHLLNNAGEVSIFHSRLTQQMSKIQFHLEELGQTVVRLREQLRGLEMATEAQIIYQHRLDRLGDQDVDPLTLERYSKIQQFSRSLAETTTDVSSLKGLLQDLVGDTEALLVQQARTAAELQDGLMRTRMVGFERQGARLARLARQTGAEHGKQVELSLFGGGEIDRQVLEKMIPPLEHMVRNAVIHGIETPAERESAGKPGTGKIAITLRREGAQVVIELNDDGRGMDIASIRSKAVDLGLCGDDEHLTDDEILQFVLRPGFSTADRLTHAAGRGVGMDVVASEIARLGGTLQIDTRPGEGTTFSVRLPFTLAVTQALIVRVGPEWFALPLPTVEGIIRISRAEFDARLTDPDAHIEYGGRQYQFRHLGQYLGLGPARIAEEQDRVSIILVRAGAHSTALVADEMLDSREVVVKPLGGQFATIRGISGATILGDGRVVVILDVASLVRTTPRPVMPEDAQPESPPEPLAMVVDDSITMRRVTQRLLERHGMRVVTAKDGVEAISMLREHTPNIILLDVEMPRMDGYEFAAHVRGNSTTADIPIIMVTSRVSDRHKARAIELGVNDYLGKPYQEARLVEAVNHLLQPGTERAK